MNFDSDDGRSEAALSWLRTSVRNIKDVSEHSGISESNLHKLRRGSTKKPRLETIERLELAQARSSHSEGPDADLLILRPTELEETATSLSPLEQSEEQSETVATTSIQLIATTDSEPTDLSPVEDKEACNSFNADDADRFMQEIFIPVHGFVWLSKAELAIVDHPSFQRLRRVRQLGMAYMVYPGATHSRFEHVLGVLHLTHRIISSLEENRERADYLGRLNDPNESCHWGRPLTAIEKRFIRLGALVHDVGHVPLGHSLEDELGLLPHHDEEERLQLIFYKNDWSIACDTPLRAILAKYYALTENRLRSIDTDISPEELVISIILHGPTRRLRHLYKKKLESDRNEGELVAERDIECAFSEDLANIGLRLNVCADIVGNTICADLLDYLHRDWHHVGKSRYAEDRILHYMEIRSDPSFDHGPLLPTDLRSSDRFIINLGRYPRLRTDAVSLILELLESRYNLAEAVLFHRSKLKLTAMLERCLTLTFEPRSNTNKHTTSRLEEQLLSMSEDSFLDQLCQDAPAFATRNLTASEALQRQRLANCIRERILYRHVHTVPFAEGRPEAILRFQNLHAEGPNAARNREQALKQLEADFGLTPGELVMYCPHTKMNSKIAEVRILVSGEIHRLDQFEEKSSDALAAGHLGAQLERFKKLWLVTFLVDPRVQTRLQFDVDQFKEWRRLLADYIQAFVIGSSTGKNLDRARAEVVRAMASNTLFKRGVGVRGDLQVGSEPLSLAARGQERVMLRAFKDGATGGFPCGASSFWLYVQSKEPIK